MPEGALGKKNFLRTKGPPKTKLTHCWCFKHGIKHSDIVLHKSKCCQNWWKLCWFLQILGDKWQMGGTSSVLKKRDKCQMGALVIFLPDGGIPSLPPMGVRGILFRGGKVIFPDFFSWCEMLLNFQWFWKVKSKQKKKKKKNVFPPSIFNFQPSLFWLSFPIFPFSLASFFSVGQQCQGGTLPPGCYGTAPTQWKHPGLYQVWLRPFQGFPKCLTSSGEAPYYSKTSKWFFFSIHFHILQQTVNPKNTNAAQQQW